MKNIFSEQSLIICAGSGGVGKTTLSAALGVLASRQGRRVLVLTIDPSQRLQTTFGIETNGSNEAHWVPGQKYSGELWASVINPAQTFKNFLQKKNPFSDSLNPLFNNFIFQELSSTLSGSQEFTSLVRLLEVSQSSKYDLIILDTPPAQHAWDFLEAPQKIEQFFDISLFKWFQKSPTLWGGLLSFGSQKVIHLLENFTGQSFMKEFRHFFIHIESWHKDIQQQCREANELLRSSKTGFFLVSTSEKSKFKEAQTFYHQLKNHHYPLKGIFINRHYPLWLDLIKNPGLENPDLQKFWMEVKTYFDEKNKDFIQFKNLLDSTLFVQSLPELQDEIYNLEGLEALAGWIEGADHEKNFSPVK